MAVRAHRHVARRDGSLEGEPDAEPTDASKEAQRDLTSLSGPVPKERRRR